jgi:thiamine-phosphate pyrophosphorylase
MLVSDRRATQERDLVEVVRAAAAGGVKLVQVREKDLDDHALRALLDAMIATLPSSMTWLVNGRPGLAAEYGIGLHLPADRLGEGRPPGVKLVGASVHDEAEAEAALAIGVDYLVAGTIFATRSKPGRPAAGPEWIGRLRLLAGATPIYAIGGVHAGNVAEVVGAGAHGVAVRSALLEAADVRSAAEELNEALSRRP